MMNELIDTLHTADCTLVVLHEGQVSTFSGRGVRTLYHLLDERPELLHSAKLAIRAAGQTAAKAMVSGGVVEVWADVISQMALHTLRTAGVRVDCEREVTHEEFLRIWQRMGE